VGEAVRAISLHSAACRRYSLILFKLKPPLICYPTVQQDFLCPARSVVPAGDGEGLLLQLRIVQLGRRRFINDIGLGIAQGLLGQAQIGTCQIFKTCAHFWIGFGFSLGEKLCGPRSLDPLYIFYATFLCNAARVNSFPETREASLCFFTPGHPRIVQKNILRTENK
jgi:hypothetical protein